MNLFCIERDIFRFELVSNVDTLLKLETYLKVVVEKSSWDRWKKVRVSSSSEEPLYTKAEGSITIKRGLLEFLKYWITFNSVGGSEILLCGLEDPKKKVPLGVSYDYLVSVYQDWPERFCSLDTLLEIDIDISLPKYWKDIFNSHPRGDYYSKAQIDGYESIARYKFGNVNLGTGIGKSYIIAALASTILKPCGGKVLVTCPSNSILEEIQLSLADHGIPYVLSPKKIEQIIDNDIILINPRGFFRSKLGKSQEVKDEFTKVKALICDELQFAASDSYKKMLESISNLRYSYGFTATADRIKGLIYHPGNIPVSNLESIGADIVGLAGCTQIVRKVDSKVALTVISTEVVDSEKLKEITDLRDRQRREVNSMEIQELVYLSPQLPIVITHIRKESPKGTLYIPFTKIEHGRFLYDRLIDLGFSTLVWHAGSAEFNGEKIEPTIKNLKKVSQEEKIDILLASSVMDEGVDLRNLQSIFLLIGSSHAKILQRCGRIMREDDAEIYILNDRNCHRLGYSKRKSKIMDYYNLKKEDIKEIKL